ncbi:ATP-dependent Clp protease proteolytic subunit [bioreactor metagenome]|uniref:ATP-dependent Clp protease proteolytic subunit n=1 Tax=bioreactor metagenome TaxID=1076179 RepID=A0A644ZMQ3_9ZZZZ
MRVTLNGYIVADDDAWIYQFFGFSVFSPANVRQALRDNPEGEDLVLEVNSPGGSVWSGDEMYTVLRGAACRTVAEVQSLAASAAFTMSMGCSQVLMSPVAQVMMHLPSISTQGDKGSHQQSIRLLDSVADAILNAFEAKSNGKRTRDELAQMMASTTWFTAQEAVDAGLADGILFQNDQVPTNVVNAVGGGIRALANAGGLPDPAQLRARYEAMKAQKPGEGAEPEENAGEEQHSSTVDGASAGNMDIWRSQAALDIEKLRF